MYSVEEDEGFVKYKPKWLRLRENDYLPTLYESGGNVILHSQNPDNRWYVPLMPHYTPTIVEPTTVARVRKSETPSISQRILWINERFESDKAKLVAITRDLIELEPNNRNELVSKLGYKLIDMTEQKDKKLQTLYDLQNDDDDWNW